MGANCRPPAVNAAAFCLPQLAPLSAAELLLPAQQKTDRIRLAAVALCLTGAAAIDKAKTPWHWGILKLSWTTLMNSYSLLLSV